MVDILCFDLSTTCTGVCAYTKKADPQIRTYSLKPPKFDVTTLGYLHKKFKIKTTRGEHVSAYVYSKNEQISLTEKKERDRQVRNAENRATLKWISKAINDSINKDKPKLILLEKCMVFGGVLTTKALAEVHGALHAIAATRGIDVIEYNVHTVRAKFSLADKVKEFAEDKTPRQLKAIPDIGKEVLKQLMEEKYGITINNTDESDAVVLLDHYLSGN